MRRRSGVAVAPRAAGAIDVFDYQAPAEVFMTKGYARRSPVTYRRFGSAAEALRFAVEELPAPILVGAVLEVLEDRFDHRAIRVLYDQPRYPLPRSLQSPEDLR
jgi:hypothetical protein